MRALLLTLVFSSIVCATPNKEGWIQLFNNNTDSARIIFTKNSTSDNNLVSAEALRGLFTTEGYFLGDHVIAAKYLLEAYNTDRDPLPLAASHSNLLGWIRHSFYENEELLQKHFTLAAETNHPVQGVFQDMLLRKWLTLGDTTKAKKVRKDIDAVPTWSMIGPFDNISNNGFAKVYPPEKEIDLSNEYIGRNGHESRWNTLNNQNPNGWLFVENHAVAGNAVFYFYNNVQSTKAQEVVLSFGSSSIFKVFLNGQEVLADSVWRDTGIDTYLRRVNLHKGRNDLLIKVGHKSSQQMANFKCRFITKDYKRVAGLSYSPLAAKGTTPIVSKEPVGVGEPFSSIDTAISSFETRLEKDSTDYEALSLLLQTYLVYERNDPLQELVKTYLPTFPKSALLLGGQAEGSYRASHSTEAQLALNEAYKIAPHYFAVWNLKLNQMMGQDDPLVLEKFLDASTPLQRTSNTGLQAYATLYSVQKKFTELFGIVDQLEEKFPHSITAVEIVASVRSVTGKKDEALQAYKTLLTTKHNEPNVYSEISQLYLQSGESDSALAILKQGQSYNPQSAELPYLYAYILFSHGKYDEALKAIEVTLKLLPTSSLAMNLKGDILTAQGKTDAAIALYQEKIKYTTDNYEAWGKLWKLQGKTPIADIAPLPDLDSLIKEATPWLDSVGETAVVARYTDVLVYPSPAVEQRTFLVIYMMDNDDIDYWQEYSFGLNTSYQSYTINRAFTRKQNGKVIDADRDRNSLVFKSLEAQDFIVVEYILHDYYQGDLAGQVYGQKGFDLTYPSYIQNLRLVTPKGKELPSKIYSEYIIPKVTETEGFVVTEMIRTSKASASSISEGFLPKDYPEREKVTYSTFGSWKSIVDWYLGLSADKDQPSPAMRAVADSLFSEAKTPLEKARRVHQYMSDNITYSYVSFRQSGWVPQKASTTLATRIGDCKDMANLGKALLKIGNVTSSITLVNTTQHSFIEHAYVGPDFDHAILAINLDGKPQFIDFTSPNTQFGTIPRMIQGAKALVVAPGNESLIMLPMDTPKSREIFRDVTVNLRDDLSLKRTVITIRKGAYAAAYRGRNKGLSHNATVKQLEKALSSAYEDFSVTLFKSDPLDILVDTIKTTLSYMAEGAVKKNGKSATYNISFIDRVTLKDFPTDTTRREVIDLTSEWYSVSNTTSQMVINYPPKWKIKNDLQPIKITSDNCAYNLTFREEKGRLTINREALFNFTTFLSSEKYKEELPTLKKIARGDSFQLLFKTR